MPSGALELYFVTESMADVFSEETSFDADVEAIRTTCRARHRDIQMTDTDLRRPVPSTHSTEVSINVRRTK